MVRSILSKSRAIATITRTNLRDSRHRCNQPFHSPPPILAPWFASPVSSDDLQKKRGSVKIAKKESCRATRHNWENRRKSKLRRGWRGRKKREGGSSKLISRVKRTVCVQRKIGLSFQLSSFVRFHCSSRLSPSSLLLFPTKMADKKNAKIRFHFSPRFVVGRFTATKRDPL